MMGKRVADVGVRVYEKQSPAASRAAWRAYNTYGPRMHANDGRVVSNFITGNGG